MSDKKSSGLHQTASARTKRKKKSHSIQLFLSSLETGRYKNGRSKESRRKISFHRRHDDIDDERRHQVRPTKKKRRSRSNIYEYLTRYYYYYFFLYRRPTTLSAHTIDIYMCVAATKIHLARCPHTNGFIDTKALPTTQTAPAKRREKRDTPQSAQTDTHSHRRPTRHNAVKKKYLIHLKKKHNTRTNIQTHMHTHEERNRATDDDCGGDQRTKMLSLSVCARRKNVCFYVCLMCCSFCRCSVLTDGDGGDDDDDDDNDGVVQTATHAFYVTRCYYSSCVRCVIRLQGI